MAFSRPRALFADPLEYPIRSNRQGSRDRHTKGPKGLAVERQFDLVDPFKKPNSELAPLAAKGGWAIVPTVLRGLRAAAAASPSTTRIAKGQAITRSARPPLFDYNAASFRAAEGHDLVALPIAGGTVRHRIPIHSLIDCPPALSRVRPTPSPGRVSRD